MPGTCAPGTAIQLCGARGSRRTLGCLVHTCWRSPFRIRPELEMDDVHCPWLDRVWYWRVAAADRTLLRSALPVALVGAKRVDSPSRTRTGPKSPARNASGVTPSAPQAHRICFPAP